MIYSKGDLRAIPCIPDVVKDSRVFEASHSVFFLLRGSLLLTTATNLLTWVPEETRETNSKRNRRWRRRSIANDLTWKGHVIWETTRETTTKITEEKRERIRTWTPYYFLSHHHHPKCNPLHSLFLLSRHLFSNSVSQEEEQTGGHSSENTHVICFVVEDEDETERQVSPIRGWNSLFSMSFEPSCCPASLVLSWPSFYWVESTSWLTSWKRVTCVLPWTSVPDSPRIHISFRL